MVRHACFDDIEPLLALIEKAVKASPNYQRHDFDRGRTMASLKRAILNPMALVAVTDDLKGMIAGEAYPAPWHQGLSIWNNFFFAEKGGIGLARFYKKWAKEFGGRNDIKLAVSFGGDRAERSGRLFEHLGCDPIGQQYRVN